MSTSITLKSNESGNEEVISLSVRDDSTAYGRELGETVATVLIAHLRRGDECMYEVMRAFIDTSAACDRDPEFDVYSAALRAVEKKTDGSEAQLEQLAAHILAFRATA